MESSLNIKVNKIDRIFHEHDKVEGVIIVNAYKGWSHSGIQLNCTGLIHFNLQRLNNSSSSDVNNKPIQILNIEQEICPAGKFPDGIKEIPFSFILKQSSSAQNLMETYHGVYISILYTITVSCDRGVMKKSLRRDFEIILEVPVKLVNIDPKPIPFITANDSLGEIKEEIVGIMPTFKITGKIHKTLCPITEPFVGELCVEESSMAIRSIELQFVRIETIQVDSSRTIREASEIQNIQIGDGNICRNFTLPIYMVFPRLFACPTNINITYPLFKIEFEVNLLIVFNDGCTITENFPIVLYRDQ